MKNFIDFNRPKPRPRPQSVFSPIQQSIVRDEVF